MNRQRAMDWEGRAIVAFAILLVVVAFAVGYYSGYNDGRAAYQEGSIEK